MTTSSSRAFGNANAALAVAEVEHDLVLRVAGTLLLRYRRSPR
ncbi:MAG: hypothetical protein WED09_02615 [Homoserinimonas sp.]